MNEPAGLTRRAQHLKGWFQVKDQAITARLRAWDPPMAEYHADPGSIGQSLARSVWLHGVSQLRLADPDLWTHQMKHQLGGRIERMPWYVHAGSLISDWLTGESQRTLLRIRFAPPELLSRRSNAYKRFELEAWQRGYEAVMLASEFRKIQAAWGWLCSDRSLTECKRAFRESRKAVRWPEVSHRWQPGEGLPVCRLREDEALHQPNHNVWATNQLKCTTSRLRDFWPWKWRKYNLWGASWYNKGLMDLFGFAPVQYLTVICLSPPYEIGFYRVNGQTSLPGARMIDGRLPSGAEELETFWNVNIETTLVKIQRARDTGRLWGPEEDWNP